MSELTRRPGFRMLRWLKLMRYPKEVRQKAAKRAGRRLLRHSQKVVAILVVILALFLGLSWLLS